jgi:hypothetical protein
MRRKPSFGAAAMVCNVLMFQTSRQGRLANSLPDASGSGRIDGDTDRH